MSKMANSEEQESPKLEPNHVEDIFGPENMFEIKGVPFHHRRISKEQMEKTIEFKPRDEDIFICSYPKSGTTWLQYLVWSIMNISDTSKKLPNLLELKKTINRFIDFNGIEDVDHIRLFVSHLPYGIIPVNPKTKYLYVIRDPKDAATSYFFMMKNSYGFETCEIHKFYDYFIKGWLVYGDYFKNVMSWYHHKDDQNVLVLFYEDILHHTEREIMRIANFLSDDKNDYANILKSDPNLVHNIINETSFQKLKVNHDQSSDTTAFHVQFFRKGIRGDYATYMRPDQIKCINDLIRDKMGEPFVSKYVHD